MEKSRQAAGALGADRNLDLLSSFLGPSTTTEPAPPYADLNPKNHAIGAGDFRRKYARTAKWGLIVGVGLTPLLATPYVYADPPMGPNQPADIDFGAPTQQVMSGEVSGDVLLGDGETIVIDSGGNATGVSIIDATPGGNGAVITGNTRIITGDGSYVLVDEDGVLTSETVIQIDGANAIIDILDGGVIDGTFSPFGSPGSAIGSTENGGPVSINNAGTLTSTRTGTGVSSFPTTIELQGANGSTITNSGLIEGGTNESGTRQNAIVFGDSRGADAATTINNTADITETVTFRRGNLVVNNSSTAANASSAQFENLTIVTEEDENGQDNDGNVRTNSSLTVTNSGTAANGDAATIGSISVGSFSNNIASVTPEDLEQYDVSVTNENGATINSVTVGAKGVVNVTNRSGSEMSSGQRSAVGFTSGTTTITNEAGATIKQTLYASPDALFGTQPNDNVAIYGEAIVDATPDNGTLDTPTVINNGSIEGTLRGVEIIGAGNIINNSVIAVVDQTMGVETRLDDPRNQTVGVKIDDGVIQNQSGAEINGGVLFNDATKTPVLYNNGIVTNDNIDRLATANGQQGFITDGVTFRGATRLRSGAEGTPTDHVGTILSGRRGVYSEGALDEDFRNAGTIQGDFSGVTIVDANGFRVVNSDTIEGGVYGVRFVDRFFFEDAVDTGDPIANKDFGQVVNTADGEIVGGVALERADFSVSTSLFDPDGVVYDQPAGQRIAGEIDNAGLLSSGGAVGSDRSAITTRTGVTLTNQAGASITSTGDTFSQTFAQGSFGSLTLAGDSDITNAGEITAGGAAVNDSLAGVVPPFGSFIQYNSQSTTILNNQSSGVVAGGAYGVDLFGSATITNSGEIRGADGVRLTRTSTLTNNALITATDDALVLGRTGVFSDQASQVFTIVNAEGANIIADSDGDNNGIAVNGVLGIDLITNAGAITGDIRTNSGDDQVLISGSVTGSTDLGGDNDVLDLIDAGGVSGAVSGGDGSDRVRLSALTQNQTFLDFSVSEFETLEKAGALQSQFTGGFSGQNGEITGGSLVVGRVADVGTPAANGLLTLSNAIAMGDGSADTLTELRVVTADSIVDQNGAEGGDIINITGDQGRQSIVNSGLIEANIQLGAGDDQVLISGSVTGSTDLGGDNDVLDLIDAGGVSGAVSGGDGSDRVRLSALTQNQTFLDFSVSEFETLEKAGALQSQFTGGFSGQNGEITGGSLVVGRVADVGTPAANGLLTLSNAIAMGDGSADTLTELRVVTADSIVDQNGAEGGDIINITGDQGRQSIFSSGLVEANIQLGGGDDKVINNFGVYTGDIELNDGDDELEVFLSQLDGSVGGEINGSIDGGDGLDTIRYSLEEGAVTLDAPPSIGSSGEPTNFERIAKGGAGIVTFNFTDAEIGGSTLTTDAFDIEGPAVFNDATTATFEGGDPLSGTIRIAPATAPDEPTGIAEGVVTNNNALVAERGVSLSGLSRLENAAGASITIGAAGVPDITGIIGDDGDQTITNSGTIDLSLSPDGINLGDGNDQLNLLLGGTIVNAATIDGGAATGDGLRLDVSTDRTIASDDFVNFEQIVLNQDVGATGDFTIAAATGADPTLDTGGGSGTSILLERGNLALVDEASSIRAETVNLAVGTRVSGNGSIFTQDTVGVGPFGTITVDTVAPGNSIGTLNFVGDYVQTGTYEVEYRVPDIGTPLIVNDSLVGRNTADGTAATVADQDADLIVVSGSADFSAGSLTLLPEASVTPAALQAAFDVAGNTNNEIRYLITRANAGFTGGPIAFLPPPGISIEQTDGPDGAGGPIQDLVLVISGTSSSDPPVVTPDPPVIPVVRTPPPQQLDNDVLLWARALARPTPRCDIEGAGPQETGRCAFSTAAYDKTNQENASSTDPDATVFSGTAGFGVQMLEDSSDELWLGLAAGYGSMDFDAPNEADGGGDGDRFDSTIWSQYRAGGVDLRAWAGASLYDIDTWRQTQLGARARADIDAVSYFTSIEGRHWFAVSDAVDVTPIVGASVLHLRRDDYNESQGGTENFLADDNDLTSVRSLLGTEVRWAPPALDERVTLSGELGWKHEFGDTKAELSGVYETDDTSTRFSQESDSIGEDFLTVGASALVALTDHSTLRLGYSGDYSGDSRNHNVSLRLSLGF